MPNNPRIFFLARAMQQSLGDADIATLCIYLQSADYRFANLSCSRLSQHKPLAISAIVEYCNKHDLVPVLETVLRQYYPQALANPVDLGPALPPRLATAIGQRYSPTMRQARRSSGIAGCVTIFTVLLTAAIGAAVYYVANGGFSLSQLNQPVGRMDTINAVQMLSPSEGWMVGQTYVEGQHDTMLLLHYSGDSWTHLPSPGRGDLKTLAMVSPAEGWAGGQDVGDESVTALLVHYQNGKWTRLDPIGGASSINTIFMTSADEGWAGSNASGLRPTLLHYSAGKWQVAENIDAPDGITDIKSIYMTSAAHGWAAGSEGTILEYKDGQWHAVASPTQHNLNSVYMVSDSEGWAVGDQGTILHYQSGKWLHLDSLNTFDLTSVAMTSANEGWAGGQESSLLHYSNGTWSVATAKVGNTSFDMTGLSLTADGNGWASGMYGNVLRLKDGAWSRFYSN